MRIIKSIVLKFINIINIIYVNLKNKSKIKSLNVSSHAVSKSIGVEILHSTYIDSASRIGSYTYIGRNTNITKSQVGRYCSIANNVSIGQGEHRLDRVSTSTIFEKTPWETLTLNDCVIENDVWIGVDSIVLRGVRIGIGAVIAANSVVTKDVPDFAIVGGVPARLIRFRFSEEKQKIILESNWWEMEKERSTLVICELEKKLKII